jgi:hypothetical protein
MNTHELDIIAETPEGLRILNVCWSLEDPAVVRREEASLEWGRKRYPDAEAFLVAHHEGSGPSPSGTRLVTVSAWRYLMGNSAPAEGNDSTSSNVSKTKARSRGSAARRAEFLARRKLNLRGSSSS